MNNLKLLGLALVFCLNSFAAEHIISIKGFQFQPKELSVRVGDTVTFINEDAFPHSAVPDAETPAFEGSGPLSKGDSFSVTLKQPGTVEVLCGVHPSMAPVVIEVVSVAHLLIEEIEARLELLKNEL